MTLKEILEQLKTINQERLLAAHHDGFLFENYPDVDALDSVILMLNFLAGKQLSDSVKVSEIFAAAEIDR